MAGKSRFLVEHVDIRRKIGDDKFTLLDGFGYYSELLDTEIWVPSGYRTDFATIPWFAQSLIQVNNETIHPAIIHDFLCDTDQFNQRTIDLVFLEALDVVNARATKRFTMFAMVRAFQSAKCLINRIRGV